MTVLLTN